MMSMMRAGRPGLFIVVLRGVVRREPRKAGFQRALFADQEEKIGAESDPERGVCRHEPMYRIHGVLPMLLLMPCYRGG